MLCRILFASVGLHALSAATSVAFVSGLTLFLLAPTALHAETRPLGYEAAESAFMQMPLDDRVKFQVLLTAAGYWQAVPNENFNSRIFDAIARFQAENGFATDGVMTPNELDRLIAIGAPMLNRWGFQSVRHPTHGGSIWVPLGMGLLQQTTDAGLKFSDPVNRLLLTYDYFRRFTMQHSFDALIADLTSRGFKVGYSKVFKDEFFVVTASNDTTDAYIRYHQYGEGGLGFSLYWSHDAIDIHGERIATLISGSLWSAMSGAPFTEPFVLKPKDEIAVSLPPTLLSPAPQLTPPPVPAPALAAPPRAAAAEPSPASSAEQKPQEKSGGSSGTGFFVARDGLVLTNAHVVNECAQIRVAVGRDNILPADIVARDVANDLALLKINHTPVRVAQIRSNVRLGENVEAFGYPLTGLLATSGNFTLGNVAALAGLGDDSRYLQISAPVQPGNSGGPLLDQSGNVVGVVSAKLNAMKVMVATNGDIPENVNFAIKASVAANFLQTNSVKFEVGEASQQLQPADVADQAKAMSVYVQCQQR